MKSFCTTALAVSGATLAGTEARPRRELEGVEPGSCYGPIADGRRRPRRPCRRLHTAPVRAASGRTLSRRSSLGTHRRDLGAFLKAAAILEAEMIRMTMASSIRMVALATTLALGASPKDAGAQSRPCGSEVRAIGINEATLHYFECGEGEPIVFVHGTLGDLNVFRTQAQTFAARFRVISYSRRYHPPNAPPRAQDVDALSAHAADLGALVKELKATPAHLVASSYGAYVALALAVDHPELVRSLVLGEPPVLPLLSRTAVGEATRQSCSDGSSSQRGKRWRAGIARKVCDDSWTLAPDLALSTTSHNPYERSWWKSKRQRSDCT